MHLSSYFFSFLGSEEETKEFISLRIKYNAHFNKERNSAQTWYTVIIHELGLDTVKMPWTVAQIKWKNLLAKYKSIIDGLKRPVKGSGIGTEDDIDELTDEEAIFLDIDWPYFGAIHKFMGKNPIISPVSVLSSSGLTIQGGSSTSRGISKGSQKRKVEEESPYRIQVKNKRLLICTETETGNLSLVPFNEGELHNEKEKQSPAKFFPSSGSSHDSSTPKSKTGRQSFREMRANKHSASGQVTAQFF